MLSVDVVILAITDRIASGSLETAAYKLVTYSHPRIPEFIPGICTAVTI